MPTSEPVAPPPSPDRGHPRRALVAVFVAAVVVVSAAIAYGYPVAPPRPGVTVAPHILATLSNGTLWTDLPLWAWHFAPGLSLKGFATSMNLSYSSTNQGATTRIAYRWSSATGLPAVRFVLEEATNRSVQGPLVVSGPEGWFEYLPAGLCEGGCIQEGIREGSSGPSSVDCLEYTKVEIRYTVYRMAETRNSVEQTWVQVNYTVGPSRAFLGEALPVANVTAPAAEDLMAVTNPTTIDFPRRGSWSLNFSARDLAPAGMAFHDRTPPLRFSAGSLGEFNATLVSEFRWDESCDSWIGLSADEGTTLTFQLFMDVRFGTLVLRYVA